MYFCRCVCALMHKCHTTLRLDRGCSESSLKKVKNKQKKTPKHNPCNWTNKHRITESWAKLRTGKKFPYRNRNNVVGAILCICYSWSQCQSSGLRVADGRFQIPNFRSSWKNQFKPILSTLSWWRMFLWKQNTSVSEAIRNSSAVDTWWGTCTSCRAAFMVTNCGWCE